MKRTELRGETDSRGEFGPTPAFPGTWIVELRHLDLGWRFTSPTPVLVSSTKESRSLIEVHVSETTLVFLDAATGAPLANTTISLLGPADGGLDADFPWARQSTDDRGRASWTLASGEYRFRRASDDEDFPPEERGGELPPTATVLWTEGGPLTREVRL